MWPPYVEIVQVALTYWLDLLLSKYGWLVLSMKKEKMMTCLTDLDVRIHRIFYNKISFKVCAAYFSSDINVQGEREVWLCHVRLPPQEIFVQMHI